MLTVLMVAEKPSISLALTQALATTPSTKRKGVSPSSPVYEYDGWFQGRPAHFKVTSTVGHMWSLDFPKEFNDGNKVTPLELFGAPTLHFEDPRPRMSEHLAHEALCADALVLWLDCDREGENICFEVLTTCRPHLEPGELGGYEGNVFRAHFSSLAADDLRAAMARLGVPNLCEARSVDARQLIDLKLGVAFSRFQTSYFRRHFPQLGKLSVTYGPCQLPTLWFCVHRHDQIATFVPQPFWTVRASLQLATGGGGTLALDCDACRGVLWKEAEAEAVVAATTEWMLSGGGMAEADAEVEHSHTPKPLPLNTIELLRLASDTCAPARRARMPLLPPPRTLPSADVARRLSAPSVLRQAGHRPRRRDALCGEALPLRVRLLPSHRDVALRRRLRPRGHAHAAAGCGMAARGPEAADERRRR